jgi:hypothetical protein
MQSKIDQERAEEAMQQLNALKQNIFASGSKSKQHGDGSMRRSRNWTMQRARH